MRGIIQLQFNSWHKGKLIYVTPFFQNIKKSKHQPWQEKFLKKSVTLYIGYEIDKILRI